jgi:hypothetical protein
MSASSLNHGGGMQSTINVLSPCRVRKSTGWGTEKINLDSEFGNKNRRFDRRKRRLTRRNAVLKGLSACTGRWGVSYDGNVPSLPDSARFDIRHS